VQRQKYFNSSCTCIGTGVFSACIYGLLDGLIIGSIVAKMAMELSTDAAFQPQETWLLWHRQRPRRPLWVEWLVKYWHKLSLGNHLLPHQLYLALLHQLCKLLFKSANDFLGIYLACNLIIVASPPYCSLLSVKPVVAQGLFVSR